MNLERNGYGHASIPPIQSGRESVTASTVNPPDQRMMLFPLDIPLAPLDPPQWVGRHRVGIDRLFAFADWLMGRRRGFQHPPQHVIPLFVVFGHRHPVDALGI